MGLKSMTQSAVLVEGGHADHEGLATPARLSGLFTPRSIAVVGASESSYWGRNVFSNLSALAFGGRVVPINPKRKTVFGMECVASLRQLDAPVDLVYIAAPTGAVPTVLDDAAAAGIRNAVIIAAGFSESGDHHRQTALVEQAARNGLTILGPNCPGFVNLADGVAAYGQQVPAGTRAGKVGIILQSGALATVVMKLAAAHSVGISKLICMGNEAVVQAVDVIDYMITDSQTSVIAMFLEQIRDGARFLGLARKALLAGKAIVVLKAGRTPAGQKSALAHTGAVAGDEAVVNAALRQAGVVRVRSLEELLIDAGLMAQGHSLKGPRMAVVTASGGACDIIADRASDEGLEMPAFAAETKSELEAYLPSFATVQNPLDTAAVDTARDTGTAAVPMDVVADMVSRDPNCDFVLYMGFNVVPQTTPAEPEREQNAARMVHVAHMLKNAPIPVIPISLSCLEVGPFARQIYDANNIFVLGGMEFGLTAIGNAVRWEAARAAAVAAGPAPALPALSPYRGKHGAWSEAEGRRILGENDVPLVPAMLVCSADEAIAAAQRLGYPAVLKICSADIAHKSDIGGVALNLRDADEVRAAYASVDRAGRTAASSGVEGVLVSPMRPRGIELFAGVTVDPSFGPTLAVGLGGIWIETLKDVSLRVLPATEEDVLAMLQSLRAKPLLEGVRGGPKVNLEKAARAIVRIAQASLSLGSALRAFEVNPLWCKDDEVEALDILVVTDDRADAC
jgi:acyl-CoA synthetase (NDP forming)